MFAVRWRACRGDALGQWDTAADPRAAGDAGHVGPGVALAAGRAAVPLLVGPRNLTERQALRLGALERLNLKINRAYLLKELFRDFWEYRRAGWAKRYLKQWFWWATHSRLPPLRDFAWLVRRHEDDILNYFRMPIDNGTVEGLNNKAKLVIHKAYGFRTAKNLHPESLPLPGQPISAPNRAYVRVRNHLL